MNERRTRQQQLSSEKIRDLRSLKNFLEELSWLLSSHSKLDFRSALQALDQFTTPGTGLGRYVSKNPNIHFLVGALPGIFSDQKYFPTNEDIVEFAVEALHLQISRWEKRSRYELIGLIVCETSNLDDEAVSRLADVLSKFVADDQKAKALFKSRAENKMSWNEIIQQLSNTNPK